jgi:hypothetical protein
MGQPPQWSPPWWAAFIFTALFIVSSIIVLRLHGFTPVDLILWLLAAYTVFIGLRARKHRSR